MYYLKIIQICHKHSLYATVRAGYEFSLWLLTLMLRLEFKSHWAGSRGGKADLKQAHEEQAGTNKYEMQPHEEELELMLLLVVSHLGEEVIPQKWGFLS